MGINPLLRHLLDEKKLKVWVLAPGQIHGDDNLDYYYDFSQSISEYDKVFKLLGVAWVWKEVTLSGYRDVINEIIKEGDGGNSVPLVLNLCDGDEVNGAPGISVIRFLDEQNIIYTGADEYFYEITTSKIPMKEAFDRYGVPNASWRAIRDEKFDAAEIISEIGTPLIVKPAVSGGSMGVGIRNVVDNAGQLDSLVLEIQKGYRGWDLLTDGLVAEKFIAGREFTVFITGSWDKPDAMRIYPPVERLFHESLPENQRFLSFDRLWEIYENETPMPMQGDFYQYGTPETSLHEKIEALSRMAYVALRGKGYTRIDIRMDIETSALFVLEANAQCGLSEDENYTSIGAILRLSGNSFADAILEIMNDGFERHIGNKKAMSI